MTDEAKTKEQLISELKELRQKVSVLKSSNEEYRQPTEEQEKFTKAFLENSTPMSITTIKKGKFVDISDTFMKLMGLERNEIIGNTSMGLGFMTKEQRAALLKELKEKGRVTNLELQVKTKRGELRHVLINSSMISVGGENYLLSVFTDITNRKSIEEALLVSEKRFRIIYENTTLGIFETTPVGKVINTNQTFAVMFGFESPQQVICEIYDLARQIYVNPDQRTEVINKVLGSPTPQRFETEYRRKDGSTFMAILEIQSVWNEENKEFHLLGFVEDITDRKRAEEALQESELKYRNLVESTYDFVFMVDRKGLFTYVNPNFEKTTGYSLSDLKGHPFTIVIAPEERETIIGRFKKDVRGDPSLPYETELLDKEGRKVVIEFLTSNLFDSRGNVTGRFGVGRNITKRKEMEMEKAELEAQNQQLKKAESLGRMAGAIVHHFNNLLQAIIGNMQMAIRKLPPDADSIKNMTAAMQTARAAEAISNQMLTYLGNISDKLEPLDLCDVCCRFLPTLQATIPKNVILETDFPPRGPTITANAGQVQQVLTNLVTNAWESVGNGQGIIHLRVKTVSAADIPIIHSPTDWRLQDNAYACLEVSDTGCGIARSNIENLFDPFFSSKLTGRGLGLAVVLGIAKAYHGTVAVQSDPGRGSTFTLYFPLTREDIRSK